MFAALNFIVVRNGYRGKKVRKVNSSRGFNLKLSSAFIFNIPIDRHTLKFSGRRVPGATQNLPEVFLDGRLMDIPGNSIMYFFIVFRIRGWAGETFRTPEKERFVRV